MPSGASTTTSDTACGGNDPAPKGCAEPGIFGVAAPRQCSCLHWLRRRALNMPRRRGNAARAPVLLGALRKGRWFSGYL